MDKSRALAALVTTLCLAVAGPARAAGKLSFADLLANLKSQGKWDGNEVPPALPPVVIAATSARYREAYRLLTGQSLEVGT